MKTCPYCRKSQGQITPLYILLFIGGVMIRMKGNKTQIITLKGDYGPERTSDSYRIEGVSFSGLHILDLFQVEPW